MKYLLSLLIYVPYLWTGYCIYAQDYSVSAITEGLKENAGAVVRKDIRHIKVSPDGRSYEMTVEYAVTILNKSGDHMSRFMEFYDLSSKLSKITTTIFNSDGKQTGKVQKSDFMDIGIGGLYNMYDDTRTIIFEPVQNTYPYTIEYIYSKEEKDFFTFPAWTPVESEEVSVQLSEISVSVPPGYKFGYKELNLPGSVEKTVAKGSETYTWSIHDFNAIDDEPLSPDPQEYLPMLILKPESFTMEKYSGNLNTWDDLGKWICKLNAERDILPEECRVKVHAMTDTIGDPYMKISTLYHFLQRTTRYVSIQLGIGGYQPFDAATVYKYGYGDCKALSNYMRSLLKEAGITGYYTLIKAGQGVAGIQTDYPAQQFNHAMLCVPLNGDTVWLECTSQTDVPGYIAGFTDDRYGLLITGDGGNLVRTKAYPWDANMQGRFAEVILDIDKGTAVTVNTTYSGAQFRYPQKMIDESLEEQKKTLLKEIAIPQFTLNNFNISSSIEGREPVGCIQLDLTLNRYVSRSGSRYFLPLNLMNHTSFLPRNLSERKRDVCFKSSYTDSDSIVYVLPDAISVEYLPEGTDLDTDFGSYHTSIMLEGNKLIYVRKMSRQKGIFPKETYPAVVEFYRQVSKADNCKAILHMKGVN